MSSRRATVLAVDSGATKIDAALIGADGRVIAAVRGRGTSFSPEDHDGSVEALVRVLQELAGAATARTAARWPTSACSASPATTCRSTTAA